MGEDAHMAAAVGSPASAAALGTAVCRRILLKESEHLTGERPQGAKGGATDGPQPRGDVTWTHTEALYSLGPSVPHVDSHTTTPHPPSPPLYGRS